MIYSLTALGVYLLILMVIAVAASRKISSTSEGFSLGDRQLSFWVTAISAHASDMSGWLFFAMPMAVYLGGVNGILVLPALLLGMFLNWQCIAPKVRQVSEEKNVSTFAGIFQSSFQDEKGLLNIVSALVNLFFLTYYLSVGFMSLGYIFEALFGLNYHMSLVISAVAIAVYTLIGGYLAIAWTDAFQGSFLLCVVLFIPIYAYSSIFSYSTYQNSLSQVSAVFTWGNRQWYEALLAILAWTPGYLGMPHIITKFMGIKNKEQIAFSKYLGLSWQFLAMSGAVLTGVVALGVFEPSHQNAEMIFVDMVQLLFHPMISSFLLCALLAAIISTMDSQLLVIASSFSNDIYRRFSKDKVNNLGYTKVFTLIVLLVAVFIASFRVTTIMSMTYFAWSGLGSSFGPVLIASLYMRPLKSVDGIVAMLMGAILSVGWGFLGTDAIPSMAPGFLFPLIYLFARSRLSV